MLRVLNQFISNIKENVGFQFGYKSRQKEKREISAGVKRFNYVEIMRANTGNLARKDTLDI